MTIKELVELKDYAATKLHGHANEDDPLEVTYTEQDRQILGLIDAEIGRQSVDNDELIKNIEELSDSLIDTLDEDVHPICDYLVYTGLHEGITTLERVAIQALQACRPEREEASE